MFDNKDYSFLDKLVLRTPFYSLDDYSADRLPEILNQQAFRQAILLASPTLYRSIEKKGFRYEALGEKERLTLFKYYNRMSFRPTPFGAFASVSIASWSADRAITLGPPQTATLQLLPSLDARRYAAHGPTGPRLLFMNPTLYRFGQTWRYVSSLADASGKLHFSLRSVAAAPLHDHLLALAGVRPVKTAAIATEISLFSNCSPQEAMDYTAFLVRAQILLSDDMPGLIEPAAPTQLLTVRTGTTLPGQVLTAPPQADPGRTFIPYYTGMHRQLEKGGVGVAVQEQLRDALRVLARIVPHGRLRELETFKEEFTARFDRQRVPLLTALDPDAGISYANLHVRAAKDRLLDGLEFPNAQSAEDTVEWTAINRLLLKIWFQNSRRGAHDPIPISDADIISLPAAEPRAALPPSLAVLFTRSANNLVLESAGGASAAALTGRFSVFGDDNRRLAGEISAAEAKRNPEVLFAEIHQRSHHHVDNINRRVQLYDHIIPVNAFPHAHERGHIPLSDLLVSVRGNQVLLESLAQGKRVIPRLPTAYNVAHNELAIFRFLCDLQYQGLRANLTFDPERFFPRLNFYPRFSYRQCIISLAKWRFSKQELGQLPSRPFSLGRLHLFRQDNGIPRHISLTQGDQQLVFDLASDREAMLFLENIRDLPSVVIREYLFPDHSLVTAKKMRHAGQYIAVLIKQQAVYQGLPAETESSMEVERRFMPGSEWLYLSIYCTAGSADQVLLQAVLPVMKQPGFVSCKWFFIRYHDPHPHLRVRVKTKPEDTGKLLSAFKTMFNREEYRDLVSDFNSKTYCRELERYTPELIDSVEDLFCAGTEVALHLIGREQPKQDRHLWPFVFIYAMALHFYNDEAPVAGFLRYMSDHFLNEFKADKAFRRELDNKYREISGALGALLSGDAMKLFSPEGNLPGFLSRVRDLGCIAAGRAPERGRELISDLIHMEVNRLFASRQRENEAVIYYCLLKFERSRTAKIKAAANGPTAGN